MTIDEIKVGQVVWSTQYSLACRITQIFRTGGVEWEDPTGDTRLEGLAFISLLDETDQRAFWIKRAAYYRQQISKLEHELDEAVINLARAEALSSDE